jgi:hypothetical protein
MGTSIGEQSVAIDQEKQDRAKAVDDIRKKLENAQVGDLHKSAIGVVWLIIGLILSTGSLEFGKRLGPMTDCPASDGCAAPNPGLPRAQL